MKFALFLFCAFVDSAISIPVSENTSISIKNTFHIKKVFEESAAIQTKSTQVTALGRVADLGDLYDARSDNFIEISRYTTELSGDAFRSTDNAYSSVDYVRTESLSEKMEKLGVGASLSVSFLGGLVSASGSGKYLNEDKKSAKSAKTSLVYSIRTVTEDLKIFSKSSRSLIDSFLLENIDATHVVVGIEWGANVVLSLEESNTDSSNNQEIQGKLEAAIKFASLSVSGSAEVDFGSSDVEKSSTFSLHLNGDIIPNSVPQTINESISFIRSIPDLIKNENSGKGKIMNYILMPISTVRNVIRGENTNKGIVQEINQELIDQFMRIFEEMKDSQLQINDVYDSVNTWKLMVAETVFANISVIKSQFDSYTNDLKLRFADLVIQFRNGDIDGETLAELINSYENGDWNTASVTRHLEAFTSIMDKIALMNLLQRHNAYFIDARTNKYKILADNYEHEIRMISVDLINVDITSFYVREIINLLEAESGKEEEEAVRYYIEDVPVDVPEVNAYLEGNVIRFFTIDKKEYIFLKDDESNIIIFDSNSFELVTAYTYSGISSNIVAIIGDTLYDIDSMRGVIRSTRIENFLTYQEQINWTQVGSFPAEGVGDRVVNSIVANGSIIYFVTLSGSVYSYDTILKTLTSLGKIPVANIYASLVMVDNILYIHMRDVFYSYDGKNFRKIPTPELRQNSGLFQFENKICRVGGNLTDPVYPDPISCYDPNDETWTVTSYMNIARRYPGIITTESGTFIVSGTGENSGSWLHSIELFNHETRLCSYIPSHFPDVVEWVQAVSFLYFRNPYEV